MAITHLGLIYLFPFNGNGAYNHCPSILVEYAYFPGFNYISGPSLSLARTC